jgi:putative mRNA 3-end processing factor
MPQVNRTPLLQLTEQGLYCAAGDFYVDPWAGVTRAIITHAHSDHLRQGSTTYLTAKDGERLLRDRVPGARVKTLPYGESIDVNGVKVSLHPAGHILGSAQVRVELHGEVWVISGDYKTAPDPTCAPFEPVRCHTFITESTFGLPIYRWPPQAEVFAEINAWWRANQAAGRTSALFGYPLGKAQRLLAGVDPSIGPIFTHGAVELVNRSYRAGGVALPPTTHVAAVKRKDWHEALVVGPPSAKGTGWMRAFGEASTAFASGWMLIRGARRRQSVDRGFVISDHVDWPALMDAVRATGAQRVLVTHGYNAIVARWLQEQGLEAYPIDARYEGEVSDATQDASDDSVSADVDRSEAA